MIEDARRVPAGTRIDADVCIVGAGAAGLAVALELDDSLDICVLEAGGRSPDRASQSLLRAGGEYNGGRAEETRVVGLGGTTRVWSGWCRPLERPAFEARGELIPDGWPISPDALRPWFDRAQRLCGLGPARYETGDWRSARMPLELNPDRAVTRLYQMSDARFGPLYEARLASSGRIRVLLHAVCTGFELERDHVSAVRVETLAGQSFPVGARYFVLASGGIENARLLLLTGEGRRRALGDDHGQLGRNFMEHPYVSAGRLHLGAPVRPAASRFGFYYPHAATHAGHEGVVRGVLTPAPALVYPAGRFMTAFFPLPPWESRPSVDSAGGRALKRLAGARRRGVWPEGGGREVAALLRDPGGTSDAIFHRLVRPRLGEARVASLRWRAFCEAHPRHTQRVCLSDVRDRFGRRTARVDWTPSPRQLESIEFGYRVVSQALADAGLGRLEWSLDDPAVTIEAGRHHMGATRMHPDPRRGVVDGDARVHGTANLFIAGSSVFPTGGFVNPTLTLVALAARLADRLSRLPAGAR